MSRGSELRFFTPLRSVQNDTDGLRKVSRRGRGKRSEGRDRFNILLILIGTLWATIVAGFIALFTQL